MSMSAAMPGIVEALPRPHVIRHLRMAERVLFIGGLSGCGKTAITVLAGTFERVEIQKFNYMIEYLCTLRMLRTIDQDVSVTMLRMLTDLDAYHLAMSREVNMRFSDLSSIFRNPGTWRYLRRLFQPGDAAASARVREERLIPHFMLHNIMVNTPPLFEALEEAARVIEMVRHPLCMIKAWRSYIERYGTDPRDFNIWISAAGQVVPFFAHGWEEAYLRANPMDRAIHSMNALIRRSRQTLEQLPEAHRRQLMVVPFERFVVEPLPWLRAMETLLDSRMTPATPRELKRQRIPRRQVADGVPRKIYRRYGCEPVKKGTNEREALVQYRQFAAKEATPEAMDVLDQLSADYEHAYLNGVPGW